MRITQYLKLIFFSVVIAISTSGKTCHAQDGASLPEDPIWVAGDSLIRKLAAILEYEDLTSEAIETLIGAPLRFVWYMQLSNGTEVISKDRLFYMQGNDAPTPFTKVSFEEGFGRYPKRLQLNVDAKVSCVSKYAVTHHLGATVEERYRFGHHSLYGSHSPPYIDLEYKKANGLYFVFSYKDHPTCATQIYLTTYLQHWVPSKNEIIANAEFIKSFLPFDESGAQLKPFGFECTPRRNNKVEPDEQVCTCTNPSHSAQCRYTVRSYYWPNGNILTYVENPR